MLILKVIMICSDAKRLQEILEELSPVFQDFDDGEHLAVSNHIVVFSRTHDLKLKCN